MSCPRAKLTVELLILKKRGKCSTPCITVRYPSPNPTLIFYGIQRGFTLNVNITSDSVYTAAEMQCAFGNSIFACDGPGQGNVLCCGNVPMRRDWEVVVQCVQDYSHSLPCRLDLSRVTIAGASIRGYYALCSAADTRIAFFISIDPVYDLWGLATNRLPTAAVLASADGWMTGWTAALQYHRRQIPGEPKVGVS